MTTTTATSGSSLLSSYIASQTESTSSTTSDSSSSLYGDYETFLNILVAQLENQDPTEPTDVSEFTAQLVQYAEVEQQINTNDKLDSILSAINSNGITPLLSYVGAYVETASSGELVVQNSQAILGYTLDEDMTSVKIYVKDSDGDTIATLTGSTEAGLNRLVWDGTCDDGTTAEDGVYSFTMGVTDSSGDAISLDDVRVIGLVTGIETNSSGSIVLKAGDLEIADTDIDAVWASIGASSSSTEEASTTSEETTTS